MNLFLQTCSNLGMINKMVRGGGRGLEKGFNGVLSFS